MLTDAEIKAAKATGDRYALRDSKIDGLELRVGTSCRQRGCSGACPGTGEHGPAKVWYLRFYIGSQRRRMKLGRFGEPVLVGAKPEPLGVAAARKLAADALARVRKGEDPAADRRHARETPTLGHVIDRYLDSINVAPRTLATHRQRLTKHVPASWRGRLVTQVTAADVRKLHGKVTREGQIRKVDGKATRVPAPVAANRTIETLRAVFSWAMVEWPEHVTSNPARGFKRNAEELRTRVMSPEERATLLATIEAGEAKPPKTEGHVSPTYAAAFRLILVTGMRPIDVVTLRHENIARRVSKGRKVWIAEWPARGEGRTKKANQRRTLNSAAIEIVEAQAKITGGAGWVFPNAAGNQTSSNQLSRTFRELRDAAGLPEEITLYVAGRHTYVSEAVMAGLPLAVVGADVDNASAVQRYAHLQRAVEDGGVSEAVLAVLQGRGK